MASVLVSHRWCLSFCAKTRRDTSLSRCPDTNPFSTNCGPMVRRSPSTSILQRLVSASLLLSRFLGCRRPGVALPFHDQGVVMLRFTFHDTSKVVVRAMCSKHSRY